MSSRLSLLDLIEQLAYIGESKLPSSHPATAFIRGALERFVANGATIDPKNPVHTDAAYAALCKLAGGIHDDLIPGLLNISGGALKHDHYIQALRDAHRGQRTNAIRTLLSHHTFTDDELAIARRFTGQAA